MLKRLSIATIISLATASGASAQNWDAPLFFSPTPMDDIGLYFFSSDRESAGGLDFPNSNGLKVIWRQSGNLNLGVHVGTGDVGAIGESILVGAELYGPLTSLSSSTGLRMNWSGGIGATFGKVGNTDYIDFSVPVGVSIGLRLGAGGMGITPFVHPRVSYDVAAITPEGGEEQTFSDFHFAVDAGAEVALGERFLLRGAASLGDRSAFGIGGALRIPRKVVAR